MKQGPVRWNGQLGFSAWWSRQMTVPRGAKSLRVTLGWPEGDSEFDLYLVSPSGRSFSEGSKELRVDSPEPGEWRVAVQAVRGQGSELSFWVEPEVLTGASRK